MQRIASSYLISAALALGALAGCGDDRDADPDADLLTRGDLLVAIPRQLDEGAAARKQETLARLAPGDIRRAGRAQDFYLAVNRQALEQRWFWSVHMQQLQPGGPLPRPLGMKVIRMRPQNGALYVFDADDRRATSDVFAPELIIDAFPIIDDDYFRHLPGSRDYVLIDPGAGRNRFGGLADMFAEGEEPSRLATELSFVQGFRGAPDGGYYEQIIPAYAEEPLDVPSDIDPNRFRIAATLGVTLQTYSESPGFVEVPAPPVTHYFLSEPFYVRNTGEIARTAQHWGFHPGMTPIEWVIGPEILEIQADPALGRPDLVAAITRGVESWNEVFGYPVFTARLATPDEKFSDDHKNYMIVDPDKSRGVAYGFLRANPNTGEIRGATIYFGGDFFQPLPTAAAPLAPTRPRPRSVALAWGTERSEPLCVLWAPAWDPRQLAGDPDAALTPAQQLERYVQYVSTHEVGHSLGLRHNFKGSLVPPTSSVMEYSLLEPSIAQPVPGPYDRQAIAYLHGRSPDLPTYPFCTDQDTVRDPECLAFDGPTPAPLTDFHIPVYTATTRQLLDGELPLIVLPQIIHDQGGSLLGFVRAGTPAQAVAAWAAALEGARPPLSPADLANDPGLGPRAEALTAAIFRELLIAPQARITTPVHIPAVLAAIAHDGELVLENVDGVRTYPTRRMVIDALSNAQALEAYLALLAAREALVAQLPGLGPDDRALTRDLIARLDAAIDPYFRR